MGVEEQGVVIEASGPTALVRAEQSGRCSGCASAGFCHGGEGGERTVEAENPLGAAKGDRVVIALPAGALLKASFRVYMVPVLGLLAGAAAVQLVVRGLAGDEAASAAAAAGGAAGAVLAFILQRRLSRRRGGEDLRPRIVRVL